MKFKSSILAVLDGVNFFSVNSDFQLNRFHQKSHHTFDLYYEYVQWLLTDDPIRKETLPFQWQLICHNT